MMHVEALMTQGTGMALTVHISTWKDVNYFFQLSGEEKNHAIDMYLHIPHNNIMSQSASLETLASYMS